MFSKVDVMLNDKTVCSSDYHYVHRAHIETLLNFGVDMKKGKLMTDFLYEDTRNQFDVLNDPVFSCESNFLWNVAPFC